MLKKGYILLLMLMAYATGSALAQIKRNSFTINDDQMVLYLDLKLNKVSIDSLLRIAAIKGTSVEALVHNDFEALKRDGWTVTHGANGMLILLKPLSELSNNAQRRPIMLAENFGNTDTRPGYPTNVAFGINNFGLKQTVRQLPSGLTRFFFPGYLSAKKVLLSGNFNDWSTLKGIMLKTDSGWIMDVKIDAGEYLYKFIVNGRWIHDTFNLLQQDDGFGGYNSIYFKYNYTFKLRGYQKAARVMVAGSFNNWNANQIVMMPSGGAWVRPIYLREGTHTYRFLIDGKWTKDPDNPNSADDGKGSTNSVLNIGEQATFKLVGFGNAKNVVVAGSFNKWDPNQLHLVHHGDHWALNYALPAGNYSYKFIVDGNWITDPANGAFVDEDGQTNSFIAVKPNHTFTLTGHNNAHVVRLSGTFNNWNEPGWTMARQNGAWTINVYLPPGKTLYKFLVDGNWIIDPGNKLWEQNEFDTGNSVLWMER